MLSNRIWMSVVPLVNHLSSKCILSCKGSLAVWWSQWALFWWVKTAHQYEHVYLCVHMWIYIEYQILEKITNFFHILKFHHQVSDWNYSQSYYPDDCNAWIIKLWKSYWSQYLILPCSAFIEHSCLTTISSRQYTH